MASILNSHFVNNTTSEKLKQLDRQNYSPGISTPTNGLSKILLKGNIMTTDQCIHVQFMVVMAQKKLDKLDFSCIQQTKLPESALRLKELSQPICVEFITVRQG